VFIEQLGLYPAMQPLNGNAETSGHRIISNSHIFLANNRLSRIAAASHDIRCEYKRHQFGHTREDRFVRHSNWTGNIYGYPGIRYGIAFFIGERKDHY
jgi:hypothetical protein